MIKAAFFDIDGTLVSFKNRRISNLSKEAIKRLREKGIKVFIATGRALFKIDNLDDFDGYITLNGCCCFVNENNKLKEIHRVSMDKDDLFALTDYIKSNKFLCRIVTSDNMFINYTNCIINMIYSLSKDKKPEVVNFKDYINKNYEKILQLNVFISRNKEKYLMNNILKNSKSSRWSWYFADINSKYGGKEVGIDKITEYYKIDLSETIAFGDGENDIGMIKHAHIGVAMGNASKELKKEADYITDDVNNEGVYNALKHFNII